MKTPPLSEPIEIFRAGRQVDSAGVVREFSEADLAAAVAAYDPKLSEAPMVVGHPQTNHPAYGWVQKLSVDGGVLKMHAHQVEPQFAEMVEAGRYKKRSASFYPPDHPSNPKPGVWYLRHVGWLGAEPPAVKGLKDAQFAAADDGIVSFSESGRSVARLFRNLRDLLIEKFGKDAADQALPSWEVGYLEEAAADDAAAGDASATPQFSAPTTTITKDTDMDKEQELADAKTAREAAEKENSELKARLAEFNEAQVRSRHIAHVAFAEAQIGAGKLLPKDKDALIATLDKISESGPVEFGEGDAKKSVDLVEWLKNGIAGNKPLVNFGEHAPGQMDDPAAPAESDADLDIKARAYAKQHNVSYAEALGKISTFVG